MKRRTEEQVEAQGADGASAMLARMRQLLLPMMAGMAAAKKDLMEWVHEMGLVGLDELFEADAQAIAGPKGKHRADRKYHRWGTTSAEMPFGGRRISVRRPRVRKKSGEGEVTLPSLAYFQEVDRLSERVMNQVLLGISTRGYEASLEPPPPATISRGTSKSAAGRHLIARMVSKMREYLSRRLEEVKLIALLLDGIEVSRRSVVVALGITVDGTKIPLGLWQGSTENAALCTALLQDLIGRGLSLDGRLLCIIDGGKGIRKALDDVLGNLAVVQRCQLHKRRNLKDHLPKSCQAHVDRVMREAYASDSAETARRRLRGLVSWLEGNGHEDAAASLREGMEETLTVLKLKLPPTLRRSLATTNAIENTLGTVRRVCRNVKHWRGGNMVRRWTAAGLVTAEKRFRRIKGYRDLPMLIAILRPEKTEEQVA